MITALVTESLAGRHSAERNGLTHIKHPNWKPNPQYPVRRLIRYWYRLTVLL